MALIFGIEADLRILYVAGFLIAFFFLLNDVYKWLKYRTKGDYEFPLLGSLFFAILFFTEDLLLGFLVSLLVVMIISTYEIRESPIWAKLMITFTFSYAYLLFFYLLSKIAAVNPQLEPISQGIFGFGLSTTIWVLLITSFIFFGRKFVLVSRFLSPNYIYLFIYALTYLLFLQLEQYIGLPWESRYFVLFLANVFIYLISGPLLSLVFGVKPVTDPKILEIVDEVSTKMKVKLRAINQVKAPILNAFAYGPFFDKRIAFVADDLAEFPEDEIRGITAHELAHHKLLLLGHTFWLLVLGLVEMLIKFALNIPASTYDYLLGRAALEFLDYYILNMLIFAVLVIFIRFLEAQADEYSKKMGYGRELSKALFKLESFYQGIAGDLGLDVQLLTGKKRTEVEKLRFSGIAGNDLYKKLINPGRPSLFMNVIVSHPLTAFRIASLVNQDKLHKVSKTRLATFQILLLLPYFRKKNLTFLRRIREQFTEALTEYYLEEYESIDSFLEATQGLFVAKQLEDRNVICLPTDIPGGIWIGKVVRAKAGKYITSPVVLEVDTGKQVLEINYNDYQVIPFDRGEPYLIKNSIAVLKDFTAKQNQLKTVIYKIHKGNGREIKKKHFGVPVRDLPSAGSQVFLHERGEFRIATVEAASYERYDEAYLTIKYHNNAGEKKPARKILLKDLITVLPPFFVIFDKKKQENQRNILESLMDEKANLVLYEKEDLEIGVPGYITALSYLEENDEKTNIQKNKSVKDYKIKFGSQTEEREYLASQVDAMLVKPPYYLFYTKKEVSLGSRVGIYWENRGKRLKYI
ncbi:MAG: M48 family metalloprotease [Candidatus Odinarchaeota archaeon]